MHGRAVPRHRTPTAAFSCFVEWPAARRWHGYQRLSQASRNFADLPTDPRKCVCLPQERGLLCRVASAHATVVAAILSLHGISWHDKTCLHLPAAFSIEQPAVRREAAPHACQGDCMSFILRAKSQESVKPLARGSATPLARGGDVAPRYAALPCSVLHAILRTKSRIQRLGSPGLAQCRQSVTVILGFRSVSGVLPSEQRSTSPTCAR